MRRFLILVPIVIILALPGIALANRYLGPFTPQFNNDGVEIKVHQHNGKPLKVTNFEWHNVPVSTCADSEIFFQDMKVHKIRGVRKFHGSGHPGEAGNPNYPPNHKVTATIHGRFKHHNKKIVGTLDLQGTFSGGCHGVDSGRLAYVAKKTG